jgi:hypothetical protein
VFNALLTNLAPYKAVMGYYLVALFGSLAMYVLSLNNRMPVCTPVMRKLFPGRRELFYDWADFVVVVLVGSVIGSIVFQPKSVLPALAAGFGWVGAVSMLAQGPPTKAS